MTVTSFPILETRSISKSFGKLQANLNINFDLKQGEIHAVLGENGAGKSTLMNILSGLYQADQGDIYIQGHKACIQNPLDAIRLGIHMVHQSFMLIPVFSVTENIILGNEPIKGISLDMDIAKSRINFYSKEYALSVDPDAIVEDLPIGIQQRVEIIKGLYRQSKFLLLDEPTSALTPQELEEFFQMLKRLTQKGVSIVFITHKLKEAMDISDRITVMRHGRIIETTTPDQTNENCLAELMVGKKISARLEKTSLSSEKVVLEIKNLSVCDEQRREIVRNVSFNIREKDILGIAGVQGNGQTQLAEALTGLCDVQNGSIYLDGHKIHPNNPRTYYEHGLGHIPEDRLKHGLVLPYMIADNQVLCSYYKTPFAGKITRNRQAVLENSKHLIEKFNINTPGPKTPVCALSGGNQQKVVLSRELSRNIRFLLANHPTRGLDVGSIAFIHSQLIELKKKGTAILLISSDLDEIFALSDRIAVMFEGRIIVVSPVDELSREDIGLYMSGINAS